MTDIEIMNYFLKQRADKDNPYSFGEIRIDKEGTMKISIRGMDDNVFTPNLFSRIENIIGREFIIKTSQYSESVEIEIDGEELKPPKKKR